MKMSSQNIPPPPQYPNYSNNDLSESNVSKEGSIMENSVIYISDNGSPNYKPALYNTPNQILPNLVNSINSTYQNLPPKSPKSNYRNVINNNNSGLLNNIDTHNNLINNNSQKAPTQWRPPPPQQQQQQQQQQTIFDNSFPNEINDIPRFYQNNNYNSKPVHPQFWMMKPKEEWEDRQEISSNVASRTRSHPNLMNDYVNLSGAESILNEILYNRSNRQYNQPLNDVSKSFMFKGHITHDQFSPIMGPTPSSPELARNGLPMYTSQGLPDHLNDPETFSAESSRLVNLLLEENKRLRSKLRQSDSKLEAVDQLERKIHNLEMLFEELLTSQRRQRLLDLQLQQASLTNYLAKNVSQSDVGGTVSCATSSAETPRPSDSRKTIISANQTIIPSSPVTANKSTTDSIAEKSIIMCSKQQKTEMAKVYFEQRPYNDQDRFLIENDCSESWIEQIHNTPLLDEQTIEHNVKCVDDDFAVKLKHAVKSVNIATSPQFSRVSDNQTSSIMNSPSELLGRKIIMSPNPCVSRNWLVHHTSASPTFRVRLSQQPSFINVNTNNRVSSTNNNTSKPTSVMNLSSS